MEARLQKAFDQWMTWDRDPESKAKMEELKSAGKTEELSKRLLGRMEFGTAGLRARMGAGFSQMNTLTIMQTVQGLVRYAQSQFSQSELSEKGIVVGFDARYNSKKWATLTAQVFSNEGVRVRLFSDICPTPYVAYCTRRHGLCVGVMCTASHNPKEDNGYKVYWNNGAQIIPPHDKGIAKSIEENLEPWSGNWDLESIPQIYERGLVSDPMGETDDAYFAALARYSTRREQNSSAPTCVYTPVHGVGTRFVKRAMEVFNLPELVEVELQKNPDPDFPTVKFPNPEEGEGVLALAIEAAEGVSSNHILASDPDADRLAVAEKQPDGKWKLFSGNELGAIFGWWAVKCWKDEGSKNAASTFLLSSTVSSIILGSIAKKEGVKFEDTLTGFKWMGSRAKELIDQGKTVLFAFEEAIGFMLGQNVLDKDGVSAAAVMAEIIAFLSQSKTSLAQQLENVYTTYGYHITSNSYFICHDKSVTNGIFERLRTWNGTAPSYPDKLAEFKITGIRDLTNGYDSREADLKAKLPVSASSQMITFYFENGAVLTMRTSGTEPKIKYYSEMVGHSRQSCLDKLDKLVAAMVDEFYQPSKNGLIARST